jgi:hypothetical protein
MTEALGLEEGGLGNALQSLLGSSSESGTILGFVASASAAFSELPGGIDSISEAASAASTSLSKLNDEADQLIKAIILLLKGQDALSYVAVTVDENGEVSES